VLLRDVGWAEDSNYIQTAMVRINGQRQVYVPIYRQQGSSSLGVINGVKKSLPDVQKRLPPNAQDVQLDLVMDQSESIRHSINGLIEAAVVGAVLVALMILLFLGSARMTLI